MNVLPRRTWIRDIFTYHGTVLPRIWRRLLVIGARALLLTVGHLELGLFVPQDITTLPFTLTGFALSVFLGFRTTTAYNRYWEGRTLWGALINTNRSFARQVLHWVGPAPGTILGDAATADLAARRRALVHYAVGFSHALRLRLREHDDTAVLARFVAPADLSKPAPCSRSFTLPVCWASACNTTCAKCWSITCRISRSRTMPRTRWDA